MSYRKLQIGQTTYEYTTGRSHTKVKGVGVFLNSEIGSQIYIRCKHCDEILDTHRDADGIDKIGVRPIDVQLAILNKVDNV
jgi:hypothetical protein